MVYEEFVREATEILMDRASLDRTEAHSHARLLLDGLTGTRYSHLISPQTTLDRGESKKLREWLQDAARGRPIPYILNRAPFFGLEFEVDERVLIPRPETELLVETTLQLLSAKSAPKIVDLGTGSGAIAVSLAKNAPMRAFGRATSPLARSKSRAATPILTAFPSDGCAAPLRGSRPSNPSRPSMPS